MSRDQNNWDLVDASAGPIVGGWLAGRSRAPLSRLARSSSLWERRIAIVATHHFIRRGELSETFRIADLLLRDTHDLIHKAVGWMLREAGKRDGSALRGFLRERYRGMPRTMLRYAIERFPEAERRRYLKGLVLTITAAAETPEFPAGTVRRLPRMDGFGTCTAPPGARRAPQGCRVFRLAARRSSTAHRAPIPLAAAARASSQRTCAGTDQAAAPRVQMARPSYRALDSSRLSAGPAHTSSPRRRGPGCRRRAPHAGTAPARHGSPEAVPAAPTSAASRRQSSLRATIRGSSARR